LLARLKELFRLILSALRLISFLNFLFAILKAIDFVDGDGTGVDTFLAVEVEVEVPVGVAAPTAVSLLMEHQMMVFYYEQYLHLQYLTHQEHYL